MTTLPQAVEIPGAKHLHSGKVRDLYELESGELLMVASDRMSAFDWILSTPIPDKGKVLTAMSLWWFEQLGVPNHIVSTDVPAELAGRAVVCEKLEMFPVECVARGYLSGSGLVDYDATGEVCGIPLRAGLVEGSRLDEPIFTPATKADLGEHDENVSYDAVVAAVGAETAEALRKLTLDIYTPGARRWPSSAGSSWPTPSSSSAPARTARSCSPTRCSRRTRAGSGRPTSGQPGKQQPSYDKQIVRDWLQFESGWDRHSGEAPPPLSDEVIERTRSAYINAYEQLTGRTFS